MFTDADYIASPLPLTTPVPCVSLQEWESATEGHTRIFVCMCAIQLVVSTHLPIPCQRTWIYLMSLSNKFNKTTFQASHREIYQSLQISESSLRSHLEQLETLGFLSKQTTINRFGKQHMLRPCMPHSAAQILKATLNRARKKSGFRLKKETPKKESPTSGEPEIFSPAMCNPVQAQLQPAAPLTKPKNNNKKTLTLTDDKKETEQHLSWEGETLSKAEALLPETVLKRPYQPRQDRASGWVPSLEDLLLSTHVDAPVAKQHIHTVIDVMAWTAEAENQFNRAAHLVRDPSLSYMRFLLKHQQPLEQDFVRHLQGRLPAAIHAEVKVLISRMKIFVHQATSPWLPTLSELKEATIHFELTKHANKAIKVSPNVAVSISAYWLRQVQQVVKSLRLSDAHVLELCYHIQHGTTNKHFDNEDELRKYRLCMAISLIKKGEWRCPKGLASLRTRYQERKAA